MNQLQALKDDYEMDAYSTDPLGDLNTEQRKAVESTEGPLLVLAGAGTGKTRVLTARVAHILRQQKAWPSEILAVTFTNKAAQEMRSRIEQTVGHDMGGLWLGTFHSSCVRILRRYAECVDRSQNFTIIDADDQLRLLKQLIKAEGLDEKKWPPRAVLSRISRWKDRGLLPDKVSQEEFRNYGGSQEDPTLMLYKMYQERLRILNAVDFGDLLLLCLELFKSNPEVLEKYQKQFKYILVDEYQDTNVAQYLWMRLLALGHNNVCCVGDDDQSIYGWRGAEVTNILKFEKDFPGAETIRLEENYRSTEHILGAASGLIAHNNQRLGKTLWTQFDGGEKIKIRSVWNGEEEARFISQEIENYQRHGEALSSMAILVRASFQTRAFEDRLLVTGTPYRVVGGSRFYERLEIRDALAYMRVIAQPHDSLAFERIINTPKRGIGTASLQILHHYARSENVSLWTATQAMIETDELKGQARSSLASLLNDFDRWRGQKDSMSPSDLVKIVLDESGYTGMWQKDRSPEAPGRLENLKEFVSAIADFDNLEGFLEHVSLVMENAAAQGSDVVSIITLHSAKGLEFDTVFLAGWEEGLFPNPRSLKENGVEEERRLAYVGITRAKKRAIITSANSRQIHGGWQSNPPSRFIEELPTEHCDREKPTGMMGLRKTTPKPQWGQGNSFQDKGRSFNRYHSIEDVEEKSNHAAKGYQVGDRVFHIKFGYGNIREVSGSKLEINFKHSGIKHVMASFVKPA